MKFKKSAPNQFAFAQLPLTVYEQSGTIEHKALATIILSRLRSGVAYSRQSYTTTTGRTIRIDRGNAWASIRTLRQDISAATGVSYSRSQVLTGLSWLERNGLILDRRLAAPKTLGRYGTIFKLSEKVMKREEIMVDVLKAHRLFTYGPIKDYRFSGRKVEYKKGSYTAERYEDNRAWRRGIEQIGFENAAYVTTGQWRFPERGDPNAAVFVPWIVVDIDRDYYPEAHEDTLAAMMDFDSAGFDPESMFIGFSGSKGFHIMLSTARIGWPIFKTSYDATQVIAQFIREMTNVEFDVSVCNPLQVYRVAGSRNMKSSLYKRMYTVNDFMDTPLEQIYKTAQDPGSWSWPKQMGEVEEELVDVLRTGANKVLKDRIGNKRKGAKRGWNGIGPILGQILDGIEESETFGDHCGRHKAAFILSMYMLEHPKQCEETRLRLGINGRHDFENPDCAFDTLQYWYDNRTYKSTDHIKLKEPFQSAQRRIARQYGRT